MEPLKSKTVSSNIPFMKQRIKRFVITLTPVIFLFLVK